MTGRLIATVLLLTAAACAQFETGPSDVARRLRIRVAFADHAPCDSSTRLVLVGNRGFPVGEGSVNGECVAEFLDVPSGRYRVSVKGADAANADEGDVEVNSVISQELQVQARHTQGSDTMHLAGTASFVSVSDLKMPSGAAKEFERASRSIEKQDWEKASERLRKALSEYSTYAIGYNNLGSVYAHLGNVAQAREALQKAIVLDDHLAPAYVNLARLSIVDKDYPAAESFLNKAMSAAPASSAEELSLLAYAQVNDGRLNQAVETSRQGHTMSLKQHAGLHLIAANAYERLNRISDSILELELYLEEQPTGIQSDKVKNALATLKAQPATR